MIASLFLNVINMFVKIADQLFRHVEGQSQKGRFLGELVARRFRIEIAKLQYQCLVTT